MSDDCEHVFRYEGVVYKVADHPRPGSGAHDRLYYDAYFCQHCLVQELKPLGRRGTTYDELLFGARPARTG